MLNSDFTCEFGLASSWISWHIIYFIKYSIIFYTKYERERNVEEGAREKYFNALEIKIHPEKS